MNIDEPRMASDIEPATRLPNFLQRAMPHLIRSNEEMAVLANAHDHLCMCFIRDLARRGVWHLLNKCETDVLCTLFDFMETKRCSESELITVQVSQSEVARECRHAQGAVQRAIEELMLFGVLVVHGCVRGRPNEYRLRVPVRQFHQRVPRKDRQNPRKRLARARALDLCRHVNHSRPGTCTFHAPAREGVHAHAQVEGGDTTVLLDDDIRSSAASVFPAADLAMAKAAAADQLRSLEMPEETIAELLAIRPPEYLVGGAQHAQLARRIESKVGFLIAAARGTGKAKVPEKAAGEGARWIAAQISRQKSRTIKELPDDRQQALIDLFLSRVADDDKRQWIERHRGNLSAIAPGKFLDALYELHVAAGT